MTLIVAHNSMNLRVFVWEISFYSFAFKEDLSIYVSKTKCTISARKHAYCEIYFAILTRLAESFEVLPRYKGRQYFRYASTFNNSIPINSSCVHVNVDSS